MMWDGPDGRICIGQPNDTAKPSYTLRSRRGGPGSIANNLLEWRRLKDWRDIASEISVYGQTDGTDGFKRPVKARVVDDEVDAIAQRAAKHFYRPIRFPAERAKNSLEAELAAHRELGVRRRRKDGWEMAVDGWTYWDGTKATPYYQRRRERRGGRRRRPARALSDLARRVFDECPGGPELPARVHRARTLGRGRCPMRPLDRIIAFVRIISAAAKGDRNAILANVALFDDDDGNPAGGQDEQPVYGAGATYLCPDPPDDDGVCCEGISLKEEDGCTVIAMRDLRLTKRIPSKVGSLGLAHYGGGFIDLSWDADHAGTQLTILAPRLDGNGNIQTSHALLMDPTSGNASVILMHQLGNAFVLNKDGDATMKSANGKTWISATNDGLAFSADAGMKLVGGVIVGNTQSAQEVALHPARRRLPHGPTSAAQDRLAP
jgi:hypothetical protein